MNKFFSIAPYNFGSFQNPLQLENLERKVLLEHVDNISSFWGKRQHPREKKLKEIKDDDYDRLFAIKITATKPPYEIDKLLNYHLNFYMVQNKGSKNEFMLHMKYVILPIIEQRFKNNTSRFKIYEDLYEKWENEISGTKKIEEETKHFDFKIKRWQFKIRWWIILFAVIGAIGVIATTIYNYFIKE